MDFNGAGGSESVGIVDLIAIRKDHRKSAKSAFRGDLFEIVFIQVKGGSARFPSEDDMARLLRVQKHHRAAHVVLAEWKRKEKLCCYLLPDVTEPVPAAKIFGKMPTIKASKVAVSTR